MVNNKLTNPCLKNLTNGELGKPPKEQNIVLQQLGLPHTLSFDYMLDGGLKDAISKLQPVEFDLTNGDRIKIRLIDANVNSPIVPHGTLGVKRPFVTPSECRQRKITYKGKLTVRIAWTRNGTEQPAFDKDLGDVPIMLKSTRCHLSRMNPKQLVEHGEHEQEWGGYFIIKGLERLIRMLLLVRRNYPICIARNGWKARGPLFSDMGVSIRCIKSDQTATTNVLHYVTDGTAKVMFSHRRILYYAPLVLILKCLCNYCDQYIYSKLVEGYEEDLHFSGCVQLMLRTLHEENLHTHEECKGYLGRMFRVRFYECPKWWSDIEIADYIISECLLIHLDDYVEKLNTLVFMTQKLYSFAQGKCKVEGADAVMMQELLLGGHLYQQVLKEKLQIWLLGLQSSILRHEGSKQNYSISVDEIKIATKVLGTFEGAMETFLATGNISSKSGLGLMQDKGLTIVPENINRMRYMSHFKAVHRGSFFQEMRTTEVRQLLPDAWGFICPVHTPDGAPCGLLNHLTLDCIITNVPDKKMIRQIPEILFSLGMKSLKKKPPKCYVTLLDGKVIGYVCQEDADAFVDNLRLLKIEGQKVPNTLEIVLVPFKENPAQFPGLFLFSGPARMMRPLINLKAGKVEYVGTFEQIYMNVCVKLTERYDVTTHMELSKTGFLSNLAQLIPMPDCNQSPRNMYQCQMGKQTMGTPVHTWDIQSENKLYRLQTPSSPLFRPVHYDHINLDDFPMGTNAIVAVVSYTGYDMEDAMIINKSAHERGFAHGSIYKTEFIELDTSASYFCRDPSQADLSTYLDSDGLPFVSRAIKDGEPWYCFFNGDLNQFIVKKFRDKENAVVHNVRLCGDFSIKRPKIACFTFRISRNPNIGDKFASRAGQKGICSQLWPTIDLPFTESGLVPDIVFNPHGFPSRMTIAMMIEIMAGKSAAIHGLVHDATPFKFNEDDTAIDYFGRLLEVAGYDYFGTETMYSGLDGREMNARIFFGIVHYQRLRHMVSDKWQVRSTGPTDVLTRQPIQGRKRGGGVRFGEMERDALISHGASFLLQDRLLHCSDKTTAFICTSCSSLLAPMTITVHKADKSHLSVTKEKCRFCNSSDGISQIQIPYIFKFLVTELASCSINVKMQCLKI